MWSKRSALAAGLLLSLSTVPAQANPAKSKSKARAELLAQRARVAAVTVTLPSKGCAGAIVGAQTQVLTAAHCIPRGAVDVPVVLPAGETQLALVATIDRRRDTALLALPQPADVEPLEWSEGSPQAGDRVLFVGRVDRPSRTQVATIQRTGRCPSLPAVQNALFTELKARPGDSGAPIVDEQLRVLGVIHGGAQCHIAAPTARLARAMNRAELPETHAEASNPDEATSLGQAISPDEATSPVLKTYRLGPFVFQKLPHGYRMRFHFDFSIGSEDSE